MAGAEGEGGALRIRSWLRVVALAWLVATVGCAGLGLERTVSERVAASGRLRVGMAGDYPPLNVRNRDGRLIGLDADLAGALAVILEVELELVEMPFGELLEALDDGRIDLAISGITMTPRRNLEVPFAGPYFISRKAMLARAELVEGAQDWTELRGRGLRVTTVAGSTSERMARARLPDAELRTAATQDEALVRVLEGDADALIGDEPAVRFALLRHPRAGLALRVSRFSAEPLGVAIAPGDPLFVNLVENYLRNLEAIGVLDTLRETWFDDPSWLGTLP